MVMWWPLTFCDLNRFGKSDCYCMLSHLYWTSHPAKLQMMQTNVFWSHFLLPPLQLEGIRTERETTAREIFELVAQQKRNDRNLSLLLLMESLSNYIIRYFFSLSNFFFHYLHQIPKSTLRRIKNLSLKNMHYKWCKDFFFLFLSYISFLFLF